MLADIFLLGVGLEGIQKKWGIGDNQVKFFSMFACKILNTLLVKTNVLIISFREYFLIFQGFAN